MKEGKIERIRAITIEALRERRRNPKGRGWPYIDRIAGVLDVGEADIIPQVPPHWDPAKDTELNREVEDDG